MAAEDLRDVDRYIARARIALSLPVVLSMYLDPVVGGQFAIDAVSLGVVAAHLTYAVTAQQLFERRAASGRLFLVCAILDVLFAAAVAVVTEGATSPAYVFFCFAIIATGCRGGVRAALRVTAASILAYTISILVLHQSSDRLWMMRPAYLGIAGCLVGFLGQERIDFERDIHELENAAQRRRIARSLHDGHVQALAATNLRLAICRDLMKAGDATTALEEIDRLQKSIAREYDGVRSFVRSLAAVPLPDAEHDDDPPPATEMQCRVEASFRAGGSLTEQILQIMLEGVRNVRRHGAARSAELCVRARHGSIRMRIDDDGIGFPAGASAPWAMASRVEDLGGHIEIGRRDGDGAHVDIELPMGEA